MTADYITGFFYEAIKVTILLSAPMLLAGLLAGFLVSIFQSATSINEMTLTFIPKMLAWPWRSFSSSLDDADPGRLHPADVHEHEPVHPLTGPARAKTDPPAMLSLSVSLPQIQLFFLVFLRTGAFLMAIPMLSGASVPVIFRIGLCLAASLLIFPLVKLGPLPVSSDVFTLAVSAAGEVLLGLLAGVTIRLIFEGVQLAGELAGDQMGLAIAEVVDPASEDQVAILSQFELLPLVTVLSGLLADPHPGGGYEIVRRSGSDQWSY
jgi:type III secretory pathway component EscT